MFNNLGIYGGAGLPGALIPMIRRPQIRRFAPTVRRVPGSGNFAANFGGIDNDIINIGGGVGPPGPPGPAGPPGTPGLVPVTIVTTTPYVALSTDYLIDVNVAGLASVSLPVSPTGTVYIIKDISGAASTNNITVTATTTIDGAPNAVINVDYGSVTLVYNGIEWNIV